MYFQSYIFREDAGDFEDEDMVYKIRKGAVKTLGAIFTSHPEVLPGIAQKAGKMLVSRFIEPVEDVKVHSFCVILAFIVQLDVLNTCISLLKAKTMLNDASAQKYFLCFLLAYLYAEQFLTNLQHLFLQLLLALPSFLSISQQRFI